MVTFSSSNSTKHHGKRFSNHTLMFIYQELNINKQVNKDKHHTRHKILKDSFYLIFFDSTLTCKNLKTHSKTKDSLNSKTLSKIKPNINLNLKKLRLAS
jgi:hypothetical protein